MPVVPKLSLKTHQHPGILPNKILRLSLLGRGVSMEFLQLSYKLWLCCGLLFFFLQGFPPWKSSLREKNAKDPWKHI